MQCHDHDGMVHYRQMRAACGLASALMILQPRESAETRKVLELARAKLERSCQGMKRLLGAENTRYQFAEAYILLKMAISDSVGTMLSQHDKQIYEDIQVVILHEMRTRLCKKSKKSTSMEAILDDYVDTGKISCSLVEAYATTMKSNLELKLLLAAFGFQPLPFPGSVDGTGALVFPRHSRRASIKSDPAGTVAGKSTRDDAWSFLVTNFDDCGMLSWQGFHWSAVKGMVESNGRVEAVFCLDPGSPFSHEVSLDPTNPSTSIYFFKKNMPLLEKMQPLVERLLGTAADEK